MRRLRIRLFPHLSRWIAWIVFGFFILLPLVYFFVDFIREPLAAPGRVFHSPAETARLAGLFGRTLFIAALTATLALAFGALAFAATEHLPQRLRGAALAVFCLPILIPGHFMAIGWIQACGAAGWLTGLLGGAPEALGPAIAISAAPGSDAALSAINPAAPPMHWLPTLLYSTAGCALVMAARLFCLTLAALWIGRRAATPAALESAALIAPPGRVWRRFLGGWLRPWMTVGWLIVFILALLDYSIPALLRRHVFSVEIISAFNVHYDPPRAMALALPLLAASLLAAGALGCALRRVRWPAARRRGARLPALPCPARAALGGGAFLLAAVSAGLPVFTLIATAGGWHNYASIFASARGQIGVSIFWSAAAAGIAAALATRLIWSLEAGGGRSAARDFLAALMLLLLALPGSVVGIANIRFWNREGFGGLLARFYDSGAMLALGLVVAGLPVAYLIIRGRLAELPAVLVEAERLRPPGGAARWWRLIAPHLASALLAAGSLVFVLGMQEVHSSILLAAPGQETLAIRAMTLLHYAPDALVAAFCLTAIAAMGLPVLFFWGLRAAIPRRKS